MNRPTWTILIATLQRRGADLARLLEGLGPQVDACGGQVRIEALWNRGERPLSEVRQALVDHADSDYVSFVDDDDELPPYHVNEVMTRLSRWPDQVGWRMQCYRDGETLKPTFHSLKYGRWWENEAGYYRDVSHLNPIRRGIALLADFRLGDPPEDVAWVDQVRPHVHTEEYVDRVMYYYHSSSGDSTWRPGSVAPPTEIELAVGPPTPVSVRYFSWHPRSSERRPSTLEQQ